MNHNDSAIREGFYLYNMNWTATLIKECLKKDGLSSVRYLLKNPAVQKKTSLLKNLKIYCDNLPGDEAAAGYQAVLKERLS